MNKKEKTKEITQIYKTLKYAHENGKSIREGGNITNYDEASILDDNHLQILRKKEYLQWEEPISRYLLTVKTKILLKEYNKKEIINKLEKIIITTQKQKQKEEQKKEWLSNCYEQTDKGILKFKVDKTAEYLSKKYDFICFEDTEKLYRYNKGIYEPARLFLEELLKKIYPEITTHKVNEVKNHVKWINVIERHELKKYDHLIALKNKILNTNTLKIEEFNPKNIIIERIPIKYEKNSKCQKFKKFLKDITTLSRTPKKDIKTIQELLGYFLVRKYYEPKAFMFVGEEGTGKSTLLNIMIQFLGKNDHINNVENISLQQLNEDKFARANLYRKLANIHDELSNEAIKNIETFKKLTGKSFIRGRMMYKQDTIDFQSYAKLVFSCNQIPNPEDNSDAYMRRWIIIELDKQFRGTELEEKDIDKKILKKEKSGILNYAIQGLKRLKENNYEFSKNTTIEQTRKRYNLRSNGLEEFIEKFCEIGWNEEEGEPFWVSTQRLRKWYNKFRKAKGLKKQSMSVIGREVNNLDTLDIKKKRKTIENENGESAREWVYTNLGLIPDFQLMEKMNKIQTKKSKMSKITLSQRKLEKPSMKGVRNNLDNLDTLISYLRNNSKNYDTKKDLIVSCITNFTNVSYDDVSDIIEDDEVLSKVFS